MLIFFYMPAAIPPPPSAKPPARPSPNPAQKALIKLGLVRPIDLALHLPLRYEDETRITPLKNAREGEVVQIEATVTACDIQQHPRRFLVVVVDDGSATSGVGWCKKVSASRTTGKGCRPC